MLPISPVLQYFPRHDLHVLVEGNCIGLERRGYSVGDAESKVLERNGHLSGGLIAKVLREFFDVLDARILNFFPGNFLDCTQGHLRIPGNCLPAVTRMHSIQLS